MKNRELSVWEKQEQARRTAERRRHLLRRGAAMGALAASMATAGGAIWHSSRTHASTLPILQATVTTAAPEASSPVSAAPATLPATVPSLAHGFDPGHDRISVYGDDGNSGSQLTAAPLQAP